MTISIPLSKTSKNKDKIYAIIDDCDKEFAELNWTADNVKGNYYAHRLLYINGRRKKERLHRVILAKKLERELLSTELVDHIDGNGLNNKRDNLRLANHSQNNWNTKRRIDNTVGHKGISLDKESGKYKVRIQFNGKRKVIGRYKSLEDAIKARQDAENLYHGEYARRE